MQIKGENHNNDNQSITPPLFMPQIIDTHDVEHARQKRKIVSFGLHANQSDITLPIEVLYGGKELVVYIPSLEVISITGDVVLVTREEGTSYFDHDECSFPPT